MITQCLGNAIGVVFWARGTKDYDTGKFGLNQSNVQGTSFANDTMLQKVLMLYHGLYIAPLGIIFFIAQSYTRMSMYAKFGLIWTNICGTSFVKHKIGQNA